jgi:hypothetical protein
LAAILLSFVVAASANLISVGQRQQRIARNYAQVETDLREALRRATRAVRHGYSVQSPTINTSAVLNFADSGVPKLLSDSTQVIVKVPEPTGSNPDTVELRFHLTNGTLYAQRSDQSSPGTALISDVSSLSISYWNTVGTTRTAVNDTTGSNVPSAATEVQFTITAVEDQATTKVSTLVAMRNKIAGSL